MNRGWLQTHRQLPRVWKLPGRPYPRSITCEERPSNFQSRSEVKVSGGQFAEFRHSTRECSRTKLPLAQIELPEQVLPEPGSRSTAAPPSGSCSPHPHPPFAPGGEALCHLIPSSVFQLSCLASDGESEVVEMNLSQVVSEHVTSWCPLSLLHSPFIEWSLFNRRMNGCWCGSFHCS